MLRLALFVKGDKEALALEVALVLSEFDVLAESGPDQEVVRLVLGDKGEEDGGLLKVSVGVEVEGEIGSLAILDKDILRTGTGSSSPRGICCAGLGTGLL